MNYIVSMERKGKIKKYPVDADSKDQAIDKVYTLADKYAHIVAISSIQDYPGRKNPKMGNEWERFYNYADNEEHPPY